MIISLENKVSKIIYKTIRDLAWSLCNRGLQVPKAINVDGSDAVVSWPTYCVSCRVSNQNIFVSYLRSDAKREFAIDNENLLNALECIHHYMNLEIKFAAEFYGDSVEEAF